MIHEPKVGELPALTEAQKARCRQMANAYEAHTPGDFMTIMREGIAAEREARSNEARKDEARWISVEERLPGKDVPVLTAGISGIEIDEWSTIWEQPLGHGGFIETGEGWMNHAEFSDVTHWMPLPAPPAALQAEQPESP